MRTGLPHKQTELVDDVPDDCHAKASQRYDLVSDSEPRIWYAQARSLHAVSGTVRYFVALRRMAEL